MAGLCVLFFFVAGANKSPEPKSGAFISLINLLTH